MLSGASPIDWTVYLVTDPAMCAARGIESTIQAAVRGGVGVVQLRDKTAPDRVLAEVARSLLPHLNAVGVPLIVNDRVALAKEIGAAGVHLGAEDLSVEEARAFLGPQAVIGLSVDTVVEATASMHQPISYLAIGPVFATRTKTDLPAPGGIELVKAVRKVCSRPLIAIGGIDRSNAASVFAAGADGVAVVSALCSASDPEREARALRSLRVQLEFRHDHA